MISNNEAIKADENAPDNALSSPKLKEADAIRKLSSALGNKLLQMYAYGSLQGSTLIFYLKHQAAVMEFDRQREEIRKRMAKIWKEEQLKGVITFTKFNAKSVARPLDKKEETRIEQDKASGNFDITCSNPALAKKFEKIKEQIKANNKQHDTQKGGG